MASRNLNVSLGLVNVPVAIEPLCEATRPAGKRVCSQHHEPMKQHLVCPVCGGDECETAYPRADRTLAFIEPPATPASSKQIELDTFVPSVGLAAIERTYKVDPAKGSEQGYSILHAALRRSGKIAIGTVMLEKAPRQIAVEAVEHGLRMHYLRYQDSYRPETLSLVPVDDAMVELACKLIEACESQSHAAIVDSYAGELRKAVEEGGEAPEPQAVPSLMAQLKATIGTNV